MKIKFGNRWYDVLKTKESCGITWYAIEDEPNHIDWINNPEDIVIVMDYEQKYKEALDRARKIENGELINVPNGTSIPVAIFPELKESEDEEIRKWLIGYFQQYKSDGIEKYANGLKIDNIIAWLEKQGEKSQEKPILEIWKSMRLEIYQQASGNRHEPNYSDDNTKIFSLNDIDEIIEKINEQKPADMVEPKFKVGDWVVFKNRNQSIYQVEKIEDGYYVLRNTHGGILIYRMILENGDLLL